MYLETLLENFNFSKITLSPIIDSIRFSNISDEEYFSITDYISNSRLSLINPKQGGSFEKYINGLSNTVSTSLSLGSAVHCIILQPKEFEIVPEVDKPTAKMGAMADILYEIYKKGKNITDKDVIESSNKVDYYKGKMSSDKINNVYSKCSKYWKNRKCWESQKLDKTPIYLDPKTRDKAYKCINSVKEHHTINKLLNPEAIFDESIIMNEAALFIHVKAKLDDKETILKLKAKLDNFTYCDGILTLNDLKTTGHLLNDFKSSFDKFHYNRQMAAYLWMLKLYIMKEYNIKTFNQINANMLLVSTIPDFKAGIMKVSKSEIEKGFKEFSELLKRVAYLQLNGYDGSVGS